MKYTRLLTELSKLVLFGNNCFFFYVTHKFLDYSNISGPISKISVLNHLIKLDKNYRNHYLNSITVVLYFLHLSVNSSNELLFQTFSEVLMDLDCLSQNV